MKKKYFLGLALLIPTILSACFSGSKSNSSNLKTTYKDYFKIGAAINKTTRESELLSEFNSFTAESILFETIAILKPCSRRHLMSSRMPS